MVFTKIVLCKKFQYTVLKMEIKPRDISKLSAYPKDFRNWGAE